MFRQEKLGRGLEWGKMLRALLCTPESSHFVLYIRTHTPPCSHSLGSKRYTHSQHGLCVSKVTRLCSQSRVTPQFHLTPPAFITIVLSQPIANPSRRRFIIW
uniref:Uncharacterized protein n=1 Tax=Cacopsylla melanoneura TaxID=428564 RepID=A0A8D8TMW0_9HEMI